MALVRKKPKQVNNETITASVATTEPEELSNVAKSVKKKNFPLKKNKEPNKVGQETAQKESTQKDKKVNKQPVKQIKEVEQLESQAPQKLTKKVKKQELPAPQMQNKTALTGKLVRKSEKVSEVEPKQEETALPPVKYHHPKKGQTAQSNVKQDKKQNFTDIHNTKPKAQKQEVGLPKIVVPTEPEHPKKSEKKPIPALPKFTINRRMLLSRLERREDFYQTFFKRIQKQIELGPDFPKGSKFLLAVSGGVDSVVLLDVFSNLAEENHYQITVAHYNHKLRGTNSNSDAEFVKRLAKSYNLPFYLSSGNVKEYATENTLSIEQAARTLRYRYLSQTAQNLKINYIFTAHTSDDSAETFLFNLFRGSGLTGLSGIPLKRRLNKSNYIFRPFLTLSKDDLIEYAKRRKLKWQEDESNSLLFYTRNKIRHELLPKLENDYNQNIKEIINRTSNLIRGADEFIKGFVEEALVRLTKDKKGMRYALKISLLDTYSDFMKGEIIQSSLMNYLKLSPVSLNTIDRIKSLALSSTGSTADITKKVFVLKDRDYLIFSKKDNVEKFMLNIDKTGNYQIKQNYLYLTEVSRKKIKFTPDPTVEFFDYDLLPMGLTIRSWESGDIFQPIGMNGTIKISDFLTNMKIPLIDKEKISLLTVKNEVVWVVGMRISEKFKVSGTTKRFLKAELKKNI